MAVEKDSTALIQAKLEAYWAWIKDDARMIGLNPYHWVRRHARARWPQALHSCLCLDDPG